MGDTGTGSLHRSMNDSEALSLIRQAVLEIAPRRAKESDEVDLDSEIADLRLDSISLMELVCCLEEKANRSFRDEELAKVTHVKDLAALVRGEQVDGMPGVRGRLDRSKATHSVAAIASGTTAREEGFDAKWSDPLLWPELKEFEDRLSAIEKIGINPYFMVHEGVAGDTTVANGQELINFSSYNYLGFSGDARVNADVERALQRYGTSVSASRIASGQRPLHVELEQALARAHGVEDALVFTAGHATNVSTIGHLLDPQDLVLHAELIHDSVLQGSKLAGAARHSFRSDDPEDLEAKLRKLRHHYAKTLIVIEGVYSMDGHVSDLPVFLQLKEKYGCVLMVDEAHSFGVLGATGRGLGEHFGIDGTRVDLWMGTLSKSLASCGGWIGGSSRLVNYLRYTTPGFVYSAGISPPNGQAALSALRYMREEPHRVEHLQANARFFHDILVERGIDTGLAEGVSAIVPCMIGDPEHAMRVSQQLLESGINVQPLVYPAVAPDAARLRFFVSTLHTEDQLMQTAEILCETLASVSQARSFS